MFSMCLKNWVGQFLTNIIFIEVVCLGNGIFNIQTIKSVACVLLLFVKLSFIILMCVLWISLIDKNKKMVYPQSMDDLEIFHWNKNAHKNKRYVQMKLQCK